MGLFWIWDCPIRNSIAHLGNVADLGNWSGLFTSGVASPLSQEGQSERTLPIFPLFPNFYPLFWFFPSFFLKLPSFFWFLAKFLLLRGTLPPALPHWLKLPSFFWFLAYFLLLMGCSAPCPPPTDYATALFSLFWAEISFFFLLLLLFLRTVNKHHFVWSVIKYGPFWQLLEAFLFSCFVPLTVDVCGKRDA